MVTGTELHFLSNVQKLHDRKAALEKVAFQREGHRELWENVIVLELMSSEESAAELEDVYMVKTLPWRSQKIDTMFQSLDMAAEKAKTPQARRQTKKRYNGGISDREKPSGSLPSWVFAKS